MVKVGERETTPCGCVIVVTSAGWCPTVERCAAHGGVAPAEVYCADAGSRFVKRGMVHFICRTCGRETPIYRRWVCSAA